MEGNQLFINKSEPGQIGDFQPAGGTGAKMGFTTFVIRFLRFLSFSGEHGGWGGGELIVCKEDLL